MEKFTAKTFGIIVDAMLKSSPEETVRNLDGDPVKNFNNLMYMRNWITKAATEAAKVAEKKHNLMPVYPGVTKP